MKIHLSTPPIDECKNEDSCGMTCVRCNQCGRWNNEKTPPFCEELPEELIQFLDRRIRNELSRSDKGN